jgi:MFS family permease
MLFTLGAGFSNHFASLIVCRFFAGLTGSPALAVGAGTNADLFVPRVRAVVSSVFLMAPFLGPSIGYERSLPFCFSVAGVLTMSTNGNVDLLLAGLPYSTRAGGGHSGASSSFLSPCSWPLCP